MTANGFASAALRNPVNAAMRSENRYTLFLIPLYRTTPDVKPGLRRGGLISFFRKHRAAFPA